jgi:hypothetical protein
MTCCELGRCRMPVLCTQSYVPPTKSAPRPCLSETHFHIHSLPISSTLFIPASLAVPLGATSAQLGVAPILTYGDTVEWNIMLSDPSQCTDFAPIAVVAELFSPFHAPPQWAQQVRHLFFQPVDGSHSVHQFPSSGWSSPAGILIPCLDSVPLTGMTYLCCVHWMYVHVQKVSWSSAYGGVANLLMPALLAHPSIFECC